MQDIHAYLNRLRKALDGIDAAPIDAAIKAFIETGANGKTIYLFGNGGSAATASHFANDLNKGCIVQGKPRFKAVCLNDNVPVMTAWANDSCYEDVFVEQLKNFLQPCDLVLGISCSGNSENVLRAMRFARENKAKTVAWTGFGGGKIKELADIAIVVPDNHFGTVEDIHMALDHLFTDAIKKRLGAR